MIRFIIYVISVRGVDDKPTLQQCKIDYFKYIKKLVNEEEFQHIVITTTYESMYDELVANGYVLTGCKCNIGSVVVSDVRC